MLQFRGRRKGNGSLGAGIPTKLELWDGRDSSKSRQWDLEILYRGPSGFFLIVKKLFSVCLHHDILIRQSVIVNFTNNFYSDQVWRGSM